MAKLHMKGFILRLLVDHPDLWEHEVADAVMREYDTEGDYWRGTVRVTLTDLYCGGLIQEVDEKVDERTGKVLFKFRVSGFGRERMRDTGLLQTQE